MKLAIVTHVWAEVHKFYAALLRSQIMSLLRHAKGIEIDFYVCLTREDWATNAVLENVSPRLRLHKIWQTKEEVGRRAIGRDIVFQQTTADWIWATDADYYFGEDCLVRLLETLQNQPSDVKLVYPKTCLISTSHDLGDEQISKLLTGEVTAPNPAEYQVHRYDRAIGGTFIVQGAYARDVGYLRGTKWQRPRPAEEGSPFADTRDDVVFRLQCLKAGRMVPVRIPNLFRYRHSASGVASHSTFVART